MRENYFLAWFNRAFTLILIVVTLSIIVLYVLPGETPENRAAVITESATSVDHWEIGDWGYAAKSPNWEVYFTAPDGVNEREQYQGGLDTVLVNAFNNAKHTIEIAAYDFDRQTLTDALIRAKERGVEIRIVADDSNMDQFVSIENAGISIRSDQRSALMHNKFIIIDRNEVWTGSLNFTENGLYRNNNHFLRFRQPEIISPFLAEFEEMFAGSFGRTSDANNFAVYEQGNVNYLVQFTPEFSPLETILNVIEGAEKSIYFLVFSFTLDEIGDQLISENRQGVNIQGIFDSLLAGGKGSEFARLKCAGIQVFLDGNPYAMHHKFFIIDEQWVMTGSMNYSQSGTEKNDENWLLIEDATLAAEYLKEFQRVFEKSRQPSDVVCS